MILKQIYLSHRQDKVKLRVMAMKNCSLFMRYSSVSYEGQLFLWLGSSYPYTGNRVSIC